MSAGKKKDESLAIVEKLLGSWIICTLADGRTAEGRLICVDRLYVRRNIIVAVLCFMRVMMIQFRPTDFTICNVL